MKNFYTYIYLDPRNPGKYIYGDYIFEFEPFYIGKGKYEQHLTHLNEAKNFLKKSTIDVQKKCSNSYKIFKIRKIINSGLEPIILKVEENLSEQQSFDLEIWLIWAIGRNDLKTGPLSNLTSGGEGCSGYIKSIETRKKLSESQKGERSHMWGKHHSSETKKKMSLSRRGEKNPLYGVHPSTETRKKMSEKKKGYVPWNKGKIGLQKMSNITKQKMSDSKGDYYIITYPNGYKITIKNLSKFCRENSLNLNPSRLYEVMNGKRKHYKGFRIQKKINNISKGDHMKNIQPTRNYMIVKITPKETKTQSGILIPEMAHPLSPLSEGVVLACGPGYMTPDGETIPLKIKKDDVVTFLMNSGLVIESGPDGEYKMLKEEEVLGLVKND